MGYETVAKDTASQLFGGGKIDEVNSAQELIPIKNIVNDMIITTDDRYIKIIEVEPSNFMLKEPAEQGVIAGTFISWLRAAPASMQIKVTTKIKRENAYVKRLIERRQKCNNELLIQVYDSIINFAKTVASTSAIERKHYLIFEYEPSKRDAGKTLSYEYISQQLTNTVLQAKDYLSNMGNMVVTQRNQNYFLGELVYEQCNPKTSLEKDFIERGTRILDDLDMLNDKREKEGVPKVDLEFVNLLAPMGVATKVTPDCVIFDKTYHSYYYISSDGYPLSVRTGWLTSGFASIPGVTIDVFIRKQNKADFIKILSQQMKFTRLKAGDRSSTNKDYGEIMDAAQSQQYIMDALSDKNNFQDPYYVVTMFTVTADTYEHLEDKCSRLEETALANMVKIVPINRYQHMGLTATLPINKIPPKIYYKARRNMTTDGVGSFYPFTEYELNDPDGLFMGINLHNRSLCTLNLYNRDKYSNANMCIFGGSGAGKTYALSLLADRLVLDGKQVFIITSEKGHEFRRICKALNGTFIKFASAENVNLNVFEIRPESDIKDELFDSAGSVSWLSKKSAAISGWLQLLFKDLTEEEKMILDRAVKETYAKKGITEDNDSIFVGNDRRNPVKEMPIIEDLLTEVKLINENPDTPVPRRIVSMLSNFVSGSYAGFNGQTNVDLSEERKIIVFDLEDIAETIESATVQLALDFIWGRVKEDPTKQKTIIIEEGWKYLSKGASEASAKLIQEIFKVIRGYGGNVILATQEIGDLVASEYGRSLIECSALKILMGVEEGASKLLQRHLNLLDSEAKALEGFRKGACFLLAGKDHIPLQIQASALEHQLISTDISDYQKQMESRKQKK